MMILHLSISVRNVLSNLILSNILYRKKSLRTELFAVQSNCKIFAFQGHYLSTFDKKQYRNTLKINPRNFFIWLINLCWWPSFRNFAIINLRRKDQTPWNHESFCPQKFLQLRSTNYQTRRKILSRFASINFVCNYYFLYNRKGKVYIRRSKYLILLFVLESGLSITKSPQLPHVTFHGHKNSFLFSSGFDFYLVTSYDTGTFLFRKS